MTSCYSGVSRRPRGSLTSLSRHPAVRPRALALAAPSPAWRDNPRWCPRSQSTKSSLRRFSPASRRPKKTCTRTNLSAIRPPCDCISPHPGMLCTLCAFSLKLPWCLMLIEHCAKFLLKCYYALVSSQHWSFSFVFFLNYLNYGHYLKKKKHFWTYFLSSPPKAIYCVRACVCVLKQNNG